MNEISDLQGVLSPEERLIARVPRPEEGWLREHLESAYEEAVSVRRQVESALKGALPRGIPFEVIEDYASVRAKEILARDKLERYGWI